MSLAACVKRILCDPDVSKAQAVASALTFLNQQSKSQYRNDPTEILELKNMVSETVNPHLKTAIDEVVERL